MLLNRTQNDPSLILPKSRRGKLRMDLGRSGWGKNTVSTWLFELQGNPDFWLRGVCNACSLAVQESHEFRPRLVKISLLERSGGKTI
jgi:hypothetical protein